MALTLKQVLACIDMGYKNAWKEFTDDEKKSVNFWTLIRYISSVKGSRIKQENAILNTNEIVNKNYLDIKLTKENSNHELMWQLMSLCGNYSDIQYHSYIKLSPRINNKKLKLLMEIYPDKKIDDLDVLSNIISNKELINLADEYGFENIKL